MTGAPLDPTTDLDKIHGCILGLAIGDAMAMPGLHNHAATLAAHGHEITDFIDASTDPVVDPVHYLLPAGTVTDDTHAAVAIMRNLAKARRATPDVFARAYIEWVDVTDDLCARLGRDRGFAGPNTLVAINQLRAGKSPLTTGFGGTTSGAAMRVGPLGFLFPGDLKATVDVVEQSCVPTHNTSTAISGASAVACAVSVIAAGETDLDAIIAAGRAGAELGAARVRDHHYAGSISRRIDAACALTRSRRPWSEIRDDLYDLLGTGMPCHEVVPAAFGLFARADGDLEAAVLLAANTGGDCDTMGAISGAMAGALMGAAAIPQRFHDKIESVNHLGLAALARDFQTALNETWRHAPAEQVPT